MVITQTKRNTVVLIMLIVLVLYLQELPEWPKGHDSINAMTESIQLWTNTTESCPEGTIPIRRTTEKDVLRASSFQKFGRKIQQQDTMSSDHQVSKIYLNAE